MSILSSHNRFSIFFTGRFLGNFAVSWLLKIPLFLAYVATELLKDEESARDNHALACNFAKYSPILTDFLLTDSAINIS